MATATAVKAAVKEVQEYVNGILEKDLERPRTPEPGDDGPPEWREFTHECTGQRMRVNTKTGKVERAR